MRVIFLSVEVSFNGYGALALIQRHACKALRQAVLRQILIPKLHFLDNLATPNIPPRQRRKDNIPLLSRRR